MVNLNNSCKLRKWGDGFRLSNPNEQDSGSEFLLEDLFNLPINTFILNNDIEILKVNRPAAITCGFTSETDAIGRTIRDVAEKNTAKTIIRCYKDFLNNKTDKINEDIYLRTDGFYFTTVTIKFTFYTEDKKKIGILGFSILNGIQTEYTLAEALAVLVNKNIFRFSVPEDINMNKLNLTSREKSIASLLVRGKTAKAISQELSLSARTVENYIFSMKNKFHLRSKPELTEFFIENM